MITVKVNGKEAQVAPGSTILDAAKAADVHIPVLCHDSRLNPFGACRVCLVEVAGSPKLMAACTTPVTDGMEILTNTEKLERVRRTTIELLLVNHPLDCPVCDKGGECTLQDLTYETGVTKIRFDTKPKDTVVDHTNPFIERDIDRCVLCGRCVRICDEVVNVEAIAFTNRGVEAEIGTAFDQPWNCEYCGQCISVCPVGSLNNRVYLFKNRPWNMESTQSVCGLCSCGCTVSIDHEDNEVFRMQEVPEEGVNHGYMCAKGRFGFDFMNSVQRETEAVIRLGDERKASVEEAVQVAADKLAEIKSAHGADSIGVVVSPRLTNEEAFAASKLAREVIGTNNVYSFEDADALPEATYEDVETSDSVLVLNIDITEANPIMGLAVRKAARMNEADLYMFYPSETALKRLTTKFVTAAPDALYAEMDKALASIQNGGGDYAEIAESLKGAEKPVVVFNPYNKADLYYVEQIKKSVPAVKLVPAKAKNNSQGILDMGCASGVAIGLGEAPAATDLMAALTDRKIRALVVLGENLVIRTGMAGIADKFDKLDLLVCTDPFMSDTAGKANVYIPVSTFAEKDGSFTNIEGRVQSINKAVDKGTVSDLEIISSVAGKLGGSIPADVAAVRSEIESANALYKGIDWDGGVVSYPYAIKEGQAKLAVKVEGSGKFYLYPSSLRLHSGSYTRWSPDLEKAYGAAKVLMSKVDAADLDITEDDTVNVTVGGQKYSFGVEIDKLVTPGCIALPEDFAETVKIFSKSRYSKVDVAK